MIIIYPLGRYIYIIINTLIVTLNIEVKIGVQTKSVMHYFVGQKNLRSKQIHTTDIVAEFTSYNNYFTVHETQKKKGKIIKIYVIPLITLTHYLCEKKKKKSCHVTLHCFLFPVFFFISPPVTCLPPRTGG
ncbi:hypothetical protein HanRHA438_Chr04g0186801 [Helianthus annuus]|nr:hypothetical protein HanRHA438_Chr04g0186801 [Helianthus annuus]